MYIEMIEIDSEQDQVRRLLKHNLGFLVGVQPF